jgi:hypothetical protein
MRHHAAVVLSLLAAVIAASGAQAAPAPPPPACTGPEYRQFDFWIGDWDVKNPAGQVVGTNRITRELDGCVLHEHWLGARGVPGESFNVWDANRRVWHQTWVDARGTLLVLEGGLDGGSMVLAGARPDTSAAGGKALERITWTPLESGDVRQHWQTSRDGGATWATAFDGRYVKRRDR